MEDVNNSNLMRLIGPVKTGANVCRTGLALALTPASKNSFINLMLPWLLPIFTSTTMDRELSNAALRRRFIRTAQRSQAAPDQDESAAPQDAFSLRLPSLSDANYHALRDNRGNRHLFTEEEMRNGNYQAPNNALGKFFRGLWPFLTGW